MLGSDLLCRRQAGAEMAAAALGGMERLEHFQELGTGDSWSAIGNIHFDAAETRLAGHRQFALTAATRVHRFDGIVDQCLEQQAKFVRRPLQRRQHRLRLPDDRDAGGEQAAGGQVEHIAQQFVEVDRTDRLAGFAGNHRAQIGERLLAGADGFGEGDRHRVRLTLAPRQHAHHRGHHVERSLEAEGGCREALAQAGDAVLVGHQHLQRGYADLFLLCAQAGDLLGHQQQVIVPLAGEEGVGGGVVLAHAASRA